MDDTIGVDISKPTLDAFRLRTREHRQFPNDRAGCAALIRWIGASAVRVVFEPTGPYHRLFEASLVAAGIAAVKVNPRSARRFAEATGELAKTDRIDAAILARMGAVLDLEGRPAKSETLHDLRELGVARQALVKDRIAASNREQIAVSPVIKRQLRARLNGLLGRQVLVTPMAGRDTSEPRRTLNPLFVEALMGWPTGWTGFGSVATEWSLWSRRMRCELWQLNCWPMDEAAA